jgi:beta-galactosidase
MKKIILLLALGFLCQPLYPQRTEYPQIGAQVFIEPGQTDKQIDGFFRILAQHGFETARIRMFGAHMLRPDGSWDFTLYDKAFDAAGKHGVKLFATLFPPTDELGDVGGFKFPRSKAHLLEIAGYIEAVVSHFRGHPALDTWVLQNEPGTGGTGPGRNDHAGKPHRRLRPTTTAT